MGYRLKDVESGTNVPLSFAVRKLAADRGTGVHQCRLLLTHSVRGFAWPVTGCFQMNHEFQFDNEYSTIGVYETVSRLWSPEN